MRRRRTFLTSSPLRNIASPKSTGVCLLRVLSPLTHSFPYPRYAPHTHTTQIDRERVSMAAAMGGWRLSCRRTALLSYYPSASLRHASSSAAASPCIASTLYDPTRKGPPTDEMLAFMEKLRSSGGSSGTVRLDMHEDYLSARLSYLSLLYSPSLVLEHRSRSLAVATTTESWS